MRTAAVTALALALASVAACGGGKGERAAAVAVTGAQAGTVVEVDGAVTATRAGAARALAVGDRVHDDDVIATGTGRVAIQLDRNRVVWRLGPRLQHQVAQSSAWSAPMATADQIATTDEHSAAAGRHAEREAADTAASAVEERAPSAAAAPAVATAEPAAAPADRPARAAELPAPAAEPPARAVEPTTRGVEQEKVPAPGGSRGGGASDDVPDLAAQLGAIAPSPPNVTFNEGQGQIGTTGGAATTGAGAGDAIAIGGDKGSAPDLTTTDSTSTDDGDPKNRRAATKVAPPPKPVAAVMALSAPSVRGPIGQGTVATQLAARAGAMAACGATEPAGAATLTFTITATGAVDAIRVTGGSSALSTCVSGQARGLRFARAKAATKVRVALTIK